MVSLYSPMEGKKIKHLRHNILEFANKIFARMNSLPSAPPDTLVTLTDSRENMEKYQKSLTSFIDKMDVVLRNQQNIQSRDILNIILTSTPTLIETDENQYRLEFVTTLVSTQPSPKKPASSKLSAPSELLSPLRSVVREANILAHSFTVDTVYESLMDPRISDAIIDELQRQFPTAVNLESMSKPDFITLITGVPEPLIQHALESPNGPVYSAIDSYFILKFEKRGTQLLQPSKSHTAHQNLGMYSTLNLQDQDETVGGVIYQAFEKLNQSHNNSPTANKFATELKLFILNASKNTKDPKPSFPSSSKIHFRNIPSSSRTFSTMTRKHYIPTPSSSFSKIQPLFMAVQGWKKLSMTNQNGWRLASSFSRVLRMGRGFGR